MRYARIQDGQPVEIIEPFFDEGRLVPIAERFTPDVVATLVEWPDGEDLPKQELPATPAVAVVTMRQARLALLAAGKLQAITSAIAALPSPQKEAAQIEWEYAATVDRASPFVQLMAQALKLDEAALDVLFEQAAAL